MAATNEEWVFTIHHGQALQLKQTLNRRRQSPSSTAPEADGCPANEGQALLVGNQATTRTRDGWTFSSPYWCLSSDVLLTVTYFPAWQALPAYTNSHYSSSLNALTACCGSAHAIDYVAQRYTTQDIVRVEHLNELRVEGISKPCQGIRLYLKPLALADLNPVPEHLQEAWQQQLAQMRESRQSLGLDDDNLGDGDGPVLTFAMPGSSAEESSASAPPLLWHVSLPAKEGSPVALESLTVLNGQLSSQQRPQPSHIYIQGYQSWSFSGSISRGQKQPTSALPPTFSKAFNFGGSPPPPATTMLQDDGEETNTPRTTKRRRRRVRADSKQHYQSDFFTCLSSSDGEFSLDESSGPALILGWLSQRQQFGVVTADADLSRLQMHCSNHGQLLVSGTAIQTDWAYCQLASPDCYDEEPLARYLECVARCSHARPLQNGPLLTGWCSWYFAYERISQALLKDNFQQLQALNSIVPTNCAVVDDGYMTAWGDWDQVKQKQFPNGMGAVAQDLLQDTDVRPGLWLAPFAADKHSQVTKRNPDWIIRNDVGAAANSSHCGKFFYGLDATNPSVRNYVGDCIRRAVQDYRYSVLKIDFLYAACLHGNGKFDLSLSRAQAMDLALQTIRDAAGPDTFLIGCGCPIGSGIGFVDAMRVSADTGPTWYPALPLPWWDQGTLPALRSMIRNSLTRASMGHRFWHNDPDCLMLGKHTRLTLQEVASAASIVAMTCGMLLLSDDLPKVPAERLDIVSKIVPLTGVSAVVLDLHSTSDDMPSLLRLWCTDEHSEAVHHEWQQHSQTTATTRNSNARATFYGRKASFRPDDELQESLRNRNCLHVTKGLGSWTVISVSNWLDKKQVVHIPPQALHLPAEAPASPPSPHGHHIFWFWSSKYAWLPPNSDDSTTVLSKLLSPHATEIVHVKPVVPDKPQYIGSDFHFSCGREVESWNVIDGSQIVMQLSTDHARTGRVFVFVPRCNTESVRVTVQGDVSTTHQVIGNTPKVGDNGSPQLVGRILAIAVSIDHSGHENAGKIVVEY